MYTLNYDIDELGYLYIDIFNDLEDISFIKVNGIDVEYIDDDNGVEFVRFHMLLFLFVSYLHFLNIDRYRIVLM